MLRGMLTNGLYQLKRVGVKIGAGMDSEQQLVYKNKGISTFVLSGGKNLVNTDLGVLKALWHIASKNANNMAYEASGLPLMEFFELLQSSQ
ncbi:hypothetical protein E6C27_scaffold34G00940 [Cucumis melo var. makuwa]|uniref:Uncharacterized protein n=1 Tax=Cucumis melo var. makuwa TaxID=1194695 RepID=A0A5A7SL22_CUCMM|nr:hypothetical protein E6C27_scaffold34G00940 [Cucumis melo var. makuwa]